MTYKDYFNWAEEYKQQAGILEKRLERRKAERKNISAAQLAAFENDCAMLYKMKLECQHTGAILEQKAVAIKERAYGV